MAPRGVGRSEPRGERSGLVLPESRSWLEAKMRRVLANTFGEGWATALGSVVDGKGFQVGSYREFATKDLQTEDKLRLAAKWGRLVNRDK